MKKIAAVDFVMPQWRLLMHQAEINNIKGLHKLWSY